MNAARSIHRSRETVRKYGPARAASSAATQRFIIRTEASDAEFNVRVSQHAGFTVTSVVAFPREFTLSFQAFHAARLLQLVVPTSTRFAAPLLTRPDPSREKSLASRSSSRLTAHTSHNSHRVKPKVNSSLGILLLQGSQALHRRWRRHQCRCSVRRDRKMRCEADRGDRAYMSQPAAGNLVPVRI